MGTVDAVSEPAPDVEPLSPWDRLEAESDPAWAAFVTFRDMGLARSITKVALACDKNRSLIGRWSATHGWIVRCEAWDEELDRERKAAQAEAVRDMASRHIKLGQLMQKISTDALDAIGEPGEVTPHQAARLGRDGVTIERLALGEPTSVDPANGEGDEAAAASLLESMRRYFEQREVGAYMEGVADGRAAEVTEQPGT